MVRRERVDGSVGRSDGGGVDERDDNGDRWMVDSGRRDASVDTATGRRAWMNNDRDKTVNGVDR